MDAVKPLTWADIEFFKSEEFDSPDAPGSGYGMNLAFVQQLDELRKRVGFPLTIHSGFRTAEHNAKVGGVGDSAHEHGLAADIGVGDGMQRMKVVREAMAMGFVRIGIGHTFVHIDTDSSLPQNVIWTYYPET